MATPKKSRLLAAAEALFENQGFHATGIDAICAAADVVRMTLYNHFSSKEALVLAVLESRHQRYLETLDQAAQANPPGETVSALLEAHGDWLRQHGRQQGCIMVRALGEYAEQAPAVHALTLEAKADLQARVAAALERDGMASGDGLALRIFLLLEGCNAAVPVTGVDATLDEARRALQAMLRSTAGAGA